MWLNSAIMSSRHTITAAFARAVLVAGLAAGLLAGCSSEGADVSCSLNDCTVTMDRGAEAQATVLNVDIKLVGVANDQVTLEVEGNKVTVPVGGGGVEVAGLNVSVQEVTGDKVVLKVTRPS
jgi:hypothetical protein